MDMKVGKDYLKIFARIIAAKGYITPSKSSIDETRLFWENMSWRIYITTGEEGARKSMKDRLILALCASASGD